MSSKSTKSSASRTRSSKHPTAPVALTVAGSDSGGGAGMQADLKVFASVGVHGTSAITCITAQNPCEVRAVQPVKTEMVAAQIEALFAELPPDAIKTGMLFSDPIIRVVAELLKGRTARSASAKSSLRSPLVVDPVMVATSGAVLLKPGAIRSLTRLLLPLADLVTPNLDEAEILIGRKIPDVESLRMAGREIFEKFGCAALVKGGHLKGNEAVDFYFDGEVELMLTAPFVKGVSTHGTGCTYSAAITGHLAHGYPLDHAVELSKGVVTDAIASSIRVGKHFVLQPFEA